MKMKLFLSLIALNLLSIGFAQSFKQKVDSLYSFKIGSLSAVEMEKKYKQLDAFWQELNADSTKYLPQVRKELATSGHSSYFYFDMCSYLEMKSTKKKDIALIEKALKNIVWSELNTWELAQKLREFALDGINVSDVAMQLLQQEKVKLSDPLTKEEFNQGKLLAYLLLPLKSELYLSKLHDQFDQVKPESQRSIVTLYWMTHSDFGRKELSEIAINKRKMPVTIEVKSYADRLNRRFSPTSEDLLLIKDLNEVEIEAKLKKDYYSIIREWDASTWNKLISISKILHQKLIIVE